jgi:hypothetical protein
MTPDLRTREAKVAQDYMRRKGYPQVRPHLVEKVQEIPCWYFYYDLPDGDLELEVFWDKGEWNTYVTAFTLREDATEQLAGR